MCNGLYWVCTHSGNMDDENMNVLLFFFTDNNESSESLWNRVCVKEPDGLREEALPQSLCLCHQAPVAPCQMAVNGKMVTGVV